VVTRVEEVTAGDHASFGGNATCHQKGVENRYSQGFSEEELERKRKNLSKKRRRAGVEPKKTTRMVWESHPVWKKFRFEGERSEAAYVWKEKASNDTSGGNTFGQPCGHEKRTG